MFGMVSAQNNAQESNKAYKQFDQKDYEKATKGVDYSEDIAKRKKKKFDELDYSEPSMPNFNFGDWSIMGDLLKTVVIGSIVLLLAYLIFRLVDQNYGNKKIINIQDHEIFENLEQHIHQVDLNDFLQQALQQGNFKLAVRIYYLIIIKKMSNSELIDWKKQKTNGEYLSEMYGKPLFENFRNSTNLFERVWYGDVEIDQDKFQVAKQLFDVLLNKIPSVNNNETR